mgnify:CR=1 FL=1
MSARGGGDGVPLPRWIGVGRHSVAAAGWRAARWDGESRFAATDLGRGPRRARYGPAVHLEPSWSRFDGSCASYAGGRSPSRRPGCFDDVTVRVWTPGVASRRAASCEPHDAVVDKPQVPNRSEDRRIAARGGRGHRGPWRQFRRLRAVSSGRAAVRRSRCAGACRSAQARRRGSRAG